MRFILAIALAVSFTAAHAATLVQVQHGATAAPKRAAVAAQNPIAFVTQVPETGFETVSSTFGSQRATISRAPRGGDLMIKYPDGTLRNLTRDAGFGNAGADQRAGAIAVRDPSVSYDGTKILFSMVVGAPTRQFEQDDFYWQLYEATGIGEGQTAHIRLIPNQPVCIAVPPIQQHPFNNVMPTYSQDGGIFFVSDMPRGNACTLYPRNDEYESQPTTTGLWKITAAGTFSQITDSPSGIFYPFVDSFGRALFISWDHMQRDQQCDTAADAAQNGCCNTANESPGAACNLPPTDVFPEGRIAANQPAPRAPHVFNKFALWSVNNGDGTSMETIVHMGDHEMQAYISQARTDDPNIVDFNAAGRFNPNPVDNWLQASEDPTTQGKFYGVDAPEFDTDSAGYIFTATAPLHAAADQIRFTYVTPPHNNDRFRKPVMQTNGVMVSDYSSATGNDVMIGNDAAYKFRIRTLLAGTDGFLHPDTYITSAAGIIRNVNQWDPDTLQTFNGGLWEMSPVEVVARPLPPTLTTGIEAPEAIAFSQAGVDPNAFTAWLKTNGLALIVSRDVTSRDDADKQQPFNLKTPSGHQTVGSGGTVYTVAGLHLYEGHAIRGEPTRDGTGSPRRRIEPVDQRNAIAAANMPAPIFPATQALGSDGSYAVLVEAGRATTFATVDTGGASVVLEREWLTFQPGEVRVCESCHGVNTLNQAGHTPPTNTPAALVSFLTFWKAHNGGGGNVPPVASFTFTTANLVANFVDTSTDADGTIASRAWAFGDGGTSTVANPAHTYTAAGTYNVTLTVTDNAGAPNAVTHAVTVSSANQPPVASFTFTVANLVANFTDTSTDPDGTIASRAWTFGDGGTSTVANPAHTYTTAGTYNVVLTVTDNSGAPNAITHAVTVTTAPPPTTYDVTISQVTPTGTVRHTFMSVPLVVSTQPWLVPLPVLHWHAQFGSDQFDFPNASNLKITQTLHGAAKPSPSPGPGQ